MPFLGKVSHQVRPEIPGEANILNHVDFNRPDSNFIPMKNAVKHLENTPTSKADYPGIKIRTARLLPRASLFK